MKTHEKLATIIMSASLGTMVLTEYVERAENDQTVLKEAKKEKVIDEKTDGEENAGNKKSG